MRRVFDYLFTTNGGLRIVFFLSAAGLWLATLWAGVHWLDFGRWLLRDATLVYDRQPAWFRVAGSVVRWLPWIAVALLVVARLHAGKRVKWISYTLGTAVTHLAFVGYLLSSPSLRIYLQRRPFDRRAWSDPTQFSSTRPARIGMIDDFLHRYDMHGWSRQRVEELLGSSDTTEYFREWDLVYWLGPERGPFPVDSEWLVVRFDRAGRVVEYRIVRD